MFYHLICCSEVNEYFLKIKDVCGVREPIWYEFIALVQILAYFTLLSALYQINWKICLFSDTDKLKTVFFLLYRYLIITFLNEQKLSRSDKLKIFFLL